MEPDSNSNSETPKKESKLSSLNIEETIKYFESKGAKLVQKTGSILVPLSKKQREAMENKDQSTPQQNQVNKGK